MSKGMAGDDSAIVGLKLLDSIEGFVDVHGRSTWF